MSEIEYSGAAPARGLAKEWKHDPQHLPVQHGINERNVRVQCDHDRLRERELQRSDERHPCEVFASHLRLLNLALRLKFLVARDPAQAASATDEDVDGARFGQSKDEEDEGAPGQPQHDPGVPVPALELDRES